MDPANKLSGRSYLLPLILLKKRKNSREMKKFPPTA